MKQLQKRFIKVEYDSKIAEVVIEKLESLGFESANKVVGCKEQELCVDDDIFYWQSERNRRCEKELTLDELFSICEPQEKEVKFEKNKIYKSNEGSVIYCTKDSESLYGYGLTDTERWQSDSNWEFVKRSECEEVNISEWQEALIKEAKRRGFKKGVKVKRDHFPLIDDLNGADNHVKHQITLRNGKFNYDGEYHGLLFNGVYVFYRGQWAEIIKGIEINGYQAEDKGDHWEFGCAKLSKNRIKELLKTMKLFNGKGKKDTQYHNRKIESIKLDSGVEITVDQLKELCQ